MATYQGICKVTGAGPTTDDLILIKLQDTGGAFNTWFNALDSFKREMLATALTAISTGYPVEVYLTATHENSIIQTMFLVLP